MFSERIALPPIADHGKLNRNYLLDGLYIISKLYPASLAIGKHFAGHDRVHLGNKEYANGEVHINTAESFNVVLERVKQGVFHSLSRRHLPRYLNEVAFLWNNRDSVEVNQNRLPKIVMKPKPILEQQEIHLDNAVGTQLRRTIRGGGGRNTPTFVWLIEPLIFFGDLRMGFWPWVNFC